MAFHKINGVQSSKLCTLKPNKHLLRQSNRSQIGTLQLRLVVPTSPSAHTALANVTEVDRPIIAEGVAQTAIDALALSTACTTLLPKIWKRNRMLMVEVVEAREAIDTASAHLRGMATVCPICPASALRERNTSHTTQHYHQTTSKSSPEPFSLAAVLLAMLSSATFLSALDQFKLASPIWISATPSSR